MTILGIDWGRARVGVAVSDELELLAHPLATIVVTSMEKLVEDLCALTRERNTREIVLGLPLNMDGSEGESARAVRRLAQRLQEAAALPVRLRDERLTSREADSRLREEGVGRRDRRAARPRQDRAAAAIILQGYLDSRKK